jgi:hypothetical protein
MALVNRDASVGDRFTRVGPSRTTYSVVSIIDKPGLPPHVRLVSDDKTGRLPMLISVSALTDSRFFRRVAS